MKLVHKRGTKNTSDRKLRNIALAAANHALETKIENQTTELTNTLQQLQAAEAKLVQKTSEMQAIWHLLGDIYFRIDANGTILEYQSSKLNNFTNQSGTVTSRQLLECLPTSIVIRFHQAINQVLQTQSLVSFEYTLPLIEDQAHFEARLLPLESKEVVVLVRDITHIVQGAFIEGGDKFRSIVENANNIIFSLTPDGLFSYVSPNWSEILGHEVTEVEGKPFVSFLHPKNLSTHTDYFTKVLITGQQQDAIEYRIKHKSGNWRWHSCYSSAIKDASGNVVYFVGICQDITVHKRAELQRQRTEKALKKSEAKFRAKTQQLEETLQKLQQTQAQLIQSEKMSSLGQLVAGIAHEINNPVNFIYGNVKYANDYVQDLLHLLELYQQHFYPPAPEIHQQIYTIDLDFIRQDLPKVLDSMNTGAERIRQIVLSLRNFSRVDEEGMKSVNIHEGIDNALLLLQNRLQAQPESPEIKVIREYGNLPFVMCHPGQMNQVFMNLLTNAIDALGEVAISSPKIQIRTYLQAGDRIIISITDNGPGMNEKVRDRIFDPFFTTKPVGKGTGMGLSISYQIVVKKHRGELYCVSTPGEGTEFVISIPTLVLEQA
ncbi:PAS domain S-box protein [Fortiea sp. LEGE XX443]|uniref:ATP-binding protein n=1 Tax=Fortiea sp. LEGE XX443 TaxID=1828611 RepID=UPI00187E2ADD|nr:ATP-binding protein [Fortiea sp. LEGE XX443]MBE9004122.1 PAS domain S-box protein [Fortiea sp. LEGE XX443]